MSTARRIAVNVARTWVHLYTSRMPTELRVTRRAEIDADLWDHDKDAQEDGVPPLVTAMEIFLRTCLGVLDDLSWCFEARQTGRGASREGRWSMMDFSVRQTRWMGMFSIAGGASVILTEYGSVRSCCSRRRWPRFGRTFIAFFASSLVFGHLPRPTKDVSCGSGRGSATIDGRGSYMRRRAQWLNNMTQNFPGIHKPYVLCQESDDTRQEPFFPLHSTPAFLCWKQIRFAC